MKETFKKMAAFGVACALSASLVACGSSDKGGDTADASLTYVSLRINPEIEMIVDENGTVVACGAVNEDGDVVLGELSPEGQSVDDACEAIVDKATELGYIDPDGEETTVYADVEAADDSTGASDIVSADSATDSSDATDETPIKVKRLRQKIADRLNSYFDNHGIYGKVSAETLAIYEEKAAEWGVSLGRVKMIMRALDLYPEKTAEELLALPVNELLALVKDAVKDKNVICSLRDEYKKAVAELKTKYAELFTLKEEADALEKQIAAAAEADKAALETTLAEKQAKIEELAAQYKTEFDALKAEYKQKTDEAKGELKEQAGLRRKNFEEKLGKHKQQFEKEKEEIKKNIENWRKGHDCIQSSDSSEN